MLLRNIFYISLVHILWTFVIVQGKIHLDSLRKTINSFPRVVIVGAGPIGLMSALMLKKLGWENIMILDKRPYETNDVARAYNYGIDGRGLLILQDLNLTHLLPEYGVPFIAITEFTEINSKGSVQKKKRIVRGVPKTKRYYLLRSVLLELLKKEIAAENESHRKASGFDGVKIMYNASVGDVEKLSDGKLMLNCVIKGSERINVTTDILLGCDGINSICRSFLEKEWNSQFGRSSSNFIKPPWLRFGKRMNPFRPFESASSYSFVKYVLLPINSSEILRIRDKKGNIFNYPCSTQELYTIEGVNSRATLGFGHINDKFKSLRAGGIFLRANDPIWKFNNSEMVAYFWKIFPQLIPDDFIKNNSISYAFSYSPGKFPKHRYCQGLQMPFFEGDKSEKNEVPSSYAILLGDAAHSFPPDLGQGVNAGFLDVHVLRSSILKHPENFSRALKQFEIKQRAEARAVTKLSMIAPFPFTEGIFAQGLFEINYFSRFYLSKAFPKWFTPPPIYSLSANQTCLYSQILREYQQSTRNLLAFLSLAVLSGFFFRFYFQP